MTQTYYSLDGSMFDLHDISSVMDELYSTGRLEAGTVYYSQSFVPLVAEDVMPAVSMYVVDCVKDTILNRLGDDFLLGLDVPVSAQRELDKLALEWVKKHIDVSIYYKPVGKVVEHVVTQEDVDC